MLHEAFVIKFIATKKNDINSDILIKSLDLIDKERINGTKELLKTVDRDINNNKKELEVFERLNKNTHKIKNIVSSDLFFDDGKTTQELLLLKKENKCHSFHLRFYL